MEIAAIAAEAILTIYFFLLVIRWGVDLLTRVGLLREPNRGVALALEGLRTTTDPLLGPIGKRVPPLRFGSLAFDLSFPLLLILLPIVNAFITALAG
ncbi:YggT family protein [Frankia sp. R43]|uniref:YggT family protein n=1 Tax=Frankia sp. R43 TaxID=269536 RepID=UPI0006CA5AD2|nr:YggT family protein [Frankia sp. R43]